MLDSRESFLWSIFISQPTGTEQAIAGEEGRTLSPVAKISYLRATSDQVIQVDQVLTLLWPLMAQGKDTGSYVLNAVIQTNQIIF